MNKQTNKTKTTHRYRAHCLILRQERKERGNEQKGERGTEDQSKSDTGEVPREWLLYACSEDG